MLPFSPTIRIICRPRLPKPGVLPDRANKPGGLTILLNFHFFGRVALNPAILSQAFRWNITWNLKIKLLSSPPFPE
jgi:hypothetical protein